MSLRPRNPIQSYERTRTDLLDALCGSEMQQTLMRLPLIEAFVLNIAEDEKECDEQWWTEQIVNRLPASRGVVQIEQYHVTWSSNLLRTCVELSVQSSYKISRTTSVES